MARKISGGRITKRTTYDAFLKEAQRLSSLAEAAMTEFLSYLYEAEQVPEIWQSTGFTFIQLLRNTNLCPPAQYRAYKDVRDKQGQQAIADVGINAVMQAGRFPDPDQQRQVISKARTWEKSNGTPIPPESARKISDDVRVHSAPRRARRQKRQASRQEIAALLAENELLRAENETLREENAALRLENEKLRRGRARRTDSAAAVA